LLDAVGAQQTREVPSQYVIPLRIAISPFKPNHLPAKDASADEELYRNAILARLNCPVVPFCTKPASRQNSPEQFNRELCSLAELRIHSGSSSTTLSSLRSNLASRTGFPMGRRTAV
tara:strand:- start:202 stop:552 length:351 start_codon:yes stop_codon:yes gene_type:complete